MTASVSTAGAYQAHPVQTGSEVGAMVSKWAPDQFSGVQEDWMVFGLKFRSYVGAMQKGTVGVWMDYVKQNAESIAKVTALPSEARGPAAVLYSCLIAV